jgi:hypothetical protein
MRIDSIMILRRRAEWRTLEIGGDGQSIVGRSGITTAVLELARREARNRAARS